MACWCCRCCVQQLEPVPHTVRALLHRRRRPPAAPQQRPTPCSAARTATSRWASAMMTSSRTRCAWQVRIVRARRGRSSADHLRFHTSSHGCRGRVQTSGRASCCIVLLLLLLMHSVLPAHSIYTGAQRSGSGGLGGTPKAGYGGAPGPFGGFGGAGMGAPKPAEVEPIAQKRFANAKAISSRCVGMGDCRDAHSAAAGVCLLTAVTCSVPCMFQCTAVPG